MNFGVKARAKVQEILDMHSQGVSVVAISARVELSERTVARILHEAGLSRKPEELRGCRMPADKAQQTIELYRAEVPVTQISKIVNFSEHTVRRLLKDKGLFEKRLAGWSEAKRNELRQRWERGETKQEISDAMGITVNSVKGHVERMGLDPHNIIYPHQEQPNENASADDKAMLALLAQHHPEKMRANYKDTRPFRGVAIMQPLMPSYGSPAALCAELGNVCGRDGWSDFRRSRKERAKRANFVRNS